MCGWHRHQSTQAGPLAGRRNRVPIGVVVGRAHPGSLVAALDGRVATAAAGSHLIARQADKREPSEAVARELTHDKAPEPTAEEGNEDERR